MSLVTRAQLRFLWLARGSMLSALLGMTIGVASVVGVHLLSAQVAWRVDQQAHPLGDVDLYLQKSSLTERDYFALRNRWRRGEFPEVVGMFPLFEGEVAIDNEPHFLVGTDPLALVSFGEQFRDGEALPVRLAEIGDFISTDSVILPRAQAERFSDSLGAAPAAVVQEPAAVVQEPAAAVKAPAAVVEASAPGIKVKLGGRAVSVLGFTAPDRVVLADLPTARAILNQPLDSLKLDYPVPNLTRVGVRLRPVVKPADRIYGFVRALFPGALAEPEATPLQALGDQWQQIAAANQNPTQQLLRSVLFNVAALSVLALVVAWLLTYQVACHALGRRAGMFERLQSLGVSLRRLRGLTQIEGIALGAAATLSGVVLGSALANLLLSLSVGEGVQFTLQLTGYVWFKAVVSGVGVASVSYWLAANQTLSKLGSPATRSAQPRSQSDVQLPGAKGVLNQRWALPAVLLAGFSWGLWGGTLIGAFCCIVVSALVLIVYLPALVDWVWRKTLLPAKELRGSTLKTLGLRQVLVGRELRLGVSALSLALATALGISIMVDSFRGAFLQMLDQRLADDAVVRVLNDAPADARELLEERVGSLATTVYWRGTIPVSVAGAAGRIEFADDPAELLDRFFASESVKFSERFESGRSIFINESFARLRNLKVGSPVDLSGNGGNVQAEIAGIFTDFGEVRPRLLGSKTLVALLGRLPDFNELYIRLAESANADPVVTLRHALGPLSNEPWLRFQGQAQVRKRSIEIFEQTFAITRALTWLALLVAAVALANALAAHGLQQQGVARQLRVLGLGAQDGRRLRRAGTLYVTSAAVLLAIPLGLIIAMLLCMLVNPLAFGWSFPVRVSLQGVAWPLIGGALGGLLAALLGDWMARRHSLASGYSLPLLMLSLLLVGCGDGDTLKESAAAGPSPGLRVGSVLGQAPAGGASAGGSFARATKVVPFKFPRDHGEHRDFRSEWWYLTCPLRASEPVSDEVAEYGVQFTLFRQAIAPPNHRPEKSVSQWRSGQIYMAHAALTDVAANRHSEVTRLARGHPELAGVRAGLPEEATLGIESGTEQTASDEWGSSFAAWLEDWRLEARNASSEEEVTSTDTSAVASGAGLNQLRLELTNKKFAASLLLKTEKPLILQGDRGLSYKGSREASYYYSLPRLSVSGVIQHTALATGADQSVPVAVEGACWFDREWSTSVLADNLAGWDWFALQFDDQSELMLFQLRAKMSEAVAQQNSRSLDEPVIGALAQGKRIAADGSATTIEPSTLDFKPLRYWRDETGARWPVEWQLQTPNRRLRVVAALDDQRMRSSIAYWEGLVWVFEGERRVGQGYLEMTGYVL